MLQSVHSLQSPGRPEGWHSMNQLLFQICSQTYSPMPTEGVVLFEILPDCVLVWLQHSIHSVCRPYCFSTDLPILSHPSLTEAGIKMDSWSHFRSRHFAANRRLRSCYLLLTHRCVKFSIDSYKNQGKGANRRLDPLCTLSNISSPAPAPAPAEHLAYACIGLCQQTLAFLVWCLPSLKGEG